MQQQQPHHPGRDGGLDGGGGHHGDEEELHQVDACQEVCLDVEKKCPFQIKNSRVDEAGGNPSFLCEGKP